MNSWGRRSSGKKLMMRSRRLVGVVRVQRRQAQVPGLGEGDRILHGFPVTDLADQDHVRRLAQGVFQRHLVGFGIDPHLALGDDAVLVVVHELDRVLDGDDMARTVLVAITDHAPPARSTCRYRWRRRR